MPIVIPNSIHPEWYNYGEYKSKIDEIFDKIPKFRRSTTEN